MTRWWITVPLLLLVGCSGRTQDLPLDEGTAGVPASPDVASGTGGAEPVRSAVRAATGGAVGSGGATGGAEVLATGGALQEAAGAAGEAVEATGGATPSPGGTLSTGGTHATGGVSATGGAATGGAATGGMSTGGAQATATGGAEPTGGATTGGSQATGGELQATGGSATGGSGTGGMAPTRCAALGAIEWTLLSDPDEGHVNYGSVETVSDVEIEILDAECLKFSPGVVTGGCTIPARPGCYGRTTVPCGGDETYRLTLPGYSSDEAVPSVRATICSGAEGYWYNNGVSGQGLNQDVGEYEIVGGEHCSSHDGSVQARPVIIATGVWTNDVWHEYDPGTPVVSVNCSGTGDLLVEFDLPE